MAQTPNPLDKTYKATSVGVSAKTIPIAGILVDVYGLGELPSNAKEISCLWLLNPRLGTKEYMKPMAAEAITAWNKHNQTLDSATRPRGLIAAAFDQRNHGTRLVDKLANEAWRSGNPKHAQDMFSVFQGTAVDTSSLIGWLPAYAFPENERIISQNMVLGVSLGGHAAWHCILHDPRISTAVVVIGCADYARVMSDRAAKSKLKTWTSTQPPGSSFLGSPDFPPALTDAVDKWDPAGLLMNEMVEHGSDDFSRDPSERELKRLLPLMTQHLAGKSILNMAGGSDKLVPYKASEPFLQWLKKAIGPGGWFAGRGVHLQDMVFEGVGHEMTPAMMQEAVQFIVKNVQEARTGTQSKI